MTTKKITKIISTENGNNYVADIEDIENRITQNSSNLETAKQELSNKCNEALIEAKAYTDTEKAKLFNSTNGTFTGQEYFRNSDTGVLRFNGGNTHDGGASLQLYPKNPNQDVYRQGVFDLVACTKEDASDAKQLIGTPAGQLTWDSKNIVRSVNGVNADENGNVEFYDYLPLAGGNITGNLTVQNKNIDVIEEQGDDYIRYANGIQICWGNFIGLSTENKRVQFQKPFLTGTPSISVNGQNASGLVSLIGWTTTLFLVSISIPSGGQFIWQAIGNWK